MRSRGGELAAFLLSLFLLLGITRAARAEDFHYALPPGFTDLSTDAQRERAQLPPAIVERLKKFKTCGLAIEDGVAIAEIDVFIGPARGSTANSIESAVSEAAKLSPKGFRLVKKEEIKQAGVTCGKIEFFTNTQNVEVHKVIYILPLGTERALIGLEARPEHFAKVRPAFEASVAAVRGLRATEDSSKNAATAGAIALAGLVGVAIRQALLRRKRRSTRTD